MKAPLTDLEPFIQSAISGELTLKDIRDYCRAKHVSPAELYNAISWAIAERFHAQLMPFAEADLGINAIFSIMTLDVFDPNGISAFPKPAYSIFLAFDRGEYSLDGSDPVEKFTKPIIKKILEEKSQYTDPC